MADNVSPIGRADVAAALALSPADAAQFAVRALSRGVWQAAALDRALDRLQAEGLTRFTPADAPRIWARFGGELARAGAADDAVPALELALMLDPGLTDAAMDRGTIAFQRAELAAAEQWFARAGSRADALAARAAVAARAGDMAAARAHATAALHQDPGLMAAHLALARAALAEGDATDAIARITALLPTAPPAQQVALLDLRAEAQDRAGDTAAAFADYAARNARIAAAQRPDTLSEPHPARAARIAAHLRQASWPPAPDTDAIGAARASAHVFLLGFPRSGTTLLEKALAGHSRIRTLEEEDHLGAAANPLVAPGALERLATLPQPQADAARQRYWDGVAATRSGAADRPVVVDKMPLNTALLPAIARLFPDARILLARRDPRDVVLSGFRRRFRMNAAMAELLSLEGAARFYAATMDVADAAMAALPLAFHSVRHEDLVADFPARMAEVLGFLGLEWEDGVADFADRAAVRAITPSDLQLRAGLNADGIGQWRRYAADLAPVLPILAPYGARYGYAD